MIKNTLAKTITLVEIFDISSVGFTKYKRLNIKATKGKTIAKCAETGCNIFTPYLKKSFKYATAFFIKYSYKIKVIFLFEKSLE
jgi:hypothetical protein